MNPYQHLFDEPAELDEQEHEWEARHDGVAPHNWRHEHHITGGNDNLRDRLGLTRRNRGDIPAH